MPYARNVSPRISRDVVFGSTTSTRIRTRPRCHGGVAMPSIASCATFAVAWNVLPRFGALSTVTSPPIDCTSRSTMDRPRPVPLERREWALSGGAFALAR